ncbi:hypothetical protein H8959_000827 [Pygathrix nigripes]
MSDKSFGIRMKKRFIFSACIWFPNITIPSQALELPTNNPDATSPDCPQSIDFPAILWPEASPASTRNQICLKMARPSSSMADFRKFFAKAKHIVIISGAGVSAESGVPTFRGAGGYWRKWQAQDLATPLAFAHNPSRVWEFYHYRREVMGSKEPNAGHRAIAECETRLGKQGRRVVVITQNIDELHRKAGTKNLLEIHGSLFKTGCTSCGVVAENYKSPICPALSGKGAPEPGTQDASIPVEKLPRCEEAGCGGLLRPHVV